MMDAAHFEPYSVCWKELLRANWVRIQDLMEQMGIEGLVAASHPTWRYLTGLPSNYSFYLYSANLAVVKKGVLAPILLPIGALASGMATLFPVDTEVEPLPFTVEACQPMGHDQWGTQLARILSQFGPNHRIALDPLLSYPMRDQLIERGVVSSLVDGQRLWREAMLIKNAEEIKCVHNAAVLAQVGMAAAVQVVGPGVSARRIAAAAEAAMRRNGAEPTLRAPSVWIGQDPSGDVTFPSERVARPGDVVSISITAASGGYHATLARSIDLGEIDRTSSRSHKLLSEAMEKALSLLSIGSSTRDVYQQIVYSANRDLDERSSMSLGFDGHGTGIGLVEYPILHDERAIEPCEICPGMAFTLSFHCEISPGHVLRLADTVIATAEGARRLIRTAVRPQATPPSKGTRDREYSH